MRMVVIMLMIVVMRLQIRIIQRQGDSMRRVPDRQRPQFLLLVQGFRIDDPTFDGNAFERVHPVIVVRVAPVRVAFSLGGEDFLEGVQIPS